MFLPYSVFVSQYFEQVIHFVDCKTSTRPKIEVGYDGLMEGESSVQSMTFDCEVIFLGFEC